MSNAKLHSYCAALNAGGASSVLPAAPPALAEGFVVSCAHRSLSGTYCSACKGVAPPVSNGVTPGEGGCRNNQSQAALSFFQAWTQEGLQACSLPSRPCWRKAPLRLFGICFSVARIAAHAKRDARHCAWFVNDLSKRPQEQFRRFTWLASLLPVCMATSKCLRRRLQL